MTELVSRRLNDREDRQVGRALARLDAQARTCEARLLSEQAKLMQAHHAGAVPVNLLKSEQQRLDRELGQAQQRLEVLNGDIEHTRAKPHDCA